MASDTDDTEEDWMITMTRWLGVSMLLLCVGSRAHAQISCPLDITLAGTSANDVLIGTAEGDRITGNGGQDELRGLAGSDCLGSGSFNDRLFGGSGNDRLTAEGGNDFLDGGEGNDELNGGSNQDVLIGGPGTDEVVGEGDDDVFIVHAGDVPAGQTETLHGGSGNDLAVFDFDPGAVPPRFFTVTDPNTGGRYRFIEVERIEIRICGNGILENGLGGETCDDGNRISGDGCDANCTPTACGNGVVTDGETCDDGNKASGDGCSASCQRECGNGRREGTEECDDGNQIPGDGCEPDCTVNPCGDGVTTPPETCDDGNRANNDGCSSTCRLECGDGTVGPNEQCDDGNTVSGDGCTAACRRECTEADVCADADPCTTDDCVAGTCVNSPLGGDAGALCELEQTLGHTPCADERIRPRRLKLTVVVLRRVLRRLSDGGDPAKLLPRAARLVNVAQAQTARLENRGRISPTCAEDLGSWLDELELLIEELRT